MGFLTFNDNNITSFNQCYHQLKIDLIKSCKLIIKLNNEIKYSKLSWR